MAVDLSVFQRGKSIIDQQQLQDAFNLRKALALNQIAGMQSGGNPPAALQLANEYRRLRSIGDNEGADNLEKFAKTIDRGLVTDESGNYQEAPGYGVAVGGIAAQRAGMQQQAKKNVDAVMNPMIAGGEAGARLDQQLIKEPLIEAAKTQAASALTGEQALSPIEQLKTINSKTFDAPFMNTGAVIARLSPFESGRQKATQTDLLRQARTDLAAPLAKQLGVNPTDKDFAASLDRIFDINSSKSSRDAQINALEIRIKNRLSNNPYANQKNNNSAVQPAVNNTTNPQSGWSVKVIK